MKYDLHISITPHAQSGSVVGRTWFGKMGNSDEDDLCALMSALSLTMHMFTQHKHLSGESVDRCIEGFYRRRVAWLDLPEDERERRAAEAIAIADANPESYGYQKPKLHLRVV